jgi:LPXTG cell wall anchor motif
MSALSRLVATTITALAVLVAVLVAPAAAQTPAYPPSVAPSSLVSRTPVPATAVRPSSLPFTGTDLAGLLLLGTLALAGGGVVLVAARRRRSPGA